MKIKDNSDPQRTWPGPYPSKEMSLPAHLLIGNGPNSIRDAINRIENFIYFSCKELYHIGKVGTEYKAWYDIKLKPTINENNFFLKVLTNVLLSILRNWLLHKEGALQ